MNDSEARRRELLRQTRKLYDEKREIPAIHPRYGRIYQDLYKDNEKPEGSSGGSFYIRLAIGHSLFCLLCLYGPEQGKSSRL